MEHIIFSCTAWLWNGHNQLAGHLSIKNKYLQFQLNSFSNGNLRIEIPIQEIEEVSTFLLFDLTRNGIKVKSKTGSIDHFVIGGIADIKKVLNLITIDN